MSFYPERVDPVIPTLKSYATEGASIAIYFLSAVLMLLIFYGGFQTIRFYSRGDIQSRFPLLLLFNTFCIFFFALFAIIGVASNVNQYALNVILLSCGGIAFTVQLLRSVRLLFTIEVRYFISRQFANQFAYNEAEVDFLLYDEQYYEQSDGDEGSFHEDGYEYDEDDEYNDDDYYDEDSVHYSASYFDYEERDEEFGNYDSEEEDEDMEHKSSSDVNNNNDVVATTGGPNDQRGVGTNGDATSIGDKSQQQESLYSGSSALSQELEAEDDLGNALGHWIFLHKSLATAPFMTGLSLFIFCKFVILTVLFTTAPGLKYAFILWLIILSLAVISCALTIASLKMVRIRSYYIYERTLQDYKDKYEPQHNDAEFIDENNNIEGGADGEIHNDSNQVDVNEAGPSPHANLPSKTSKTKDDKDISAVRSRGASTQHKSRHHNDHDSSSNRRDSVNNTKTDRIRSESETSDHHTSRIGTGVGSTHHSKHEGSRHGNSSGGLKRATGGQQFLNAADNNGAIGIFGAVIVTTNKTELDKNKPIPKGLTKRTPQSQQQQQQQRRNNQSTTDSSRLTSTTARSTTSSTGGKESTLSHGDNLDLQQQQQEEVDPNRPPPPQPPPTSLFTSAGDPSRQMLELLTSAMLSGLFYGIALIIAIIYSAQYESSQYGYFTLTPTKYSPPFTRGILVLLLLSKIVIVYSSLVHTLISDYLMAIKYSLLGGSPTVDVAQSAMDELDSLKKILSDIQARDEFRKFLDGEFSAENLLFWNAIEEYRSRPAAHFQSRTDTISSAKYIFSTYLAPGGVYEVNISSQCREKISSRLKVLLNDDPIAAVRQLENYEISAALTDWMTHGTLYHTFLCEPGSNEVKIREFGNPEEEPQLPKGARAIASQVVNQHAKLINDERRPELSMNPYPVNLFEQYCLIQVRDIYDSIMKQMSQGQQHQGGDNRGGNKAMHFDHQLSKLSRQHGGDYASRHGGNNNQHQGHVQNIQEDDDGPLSAPPQLPDYHITQLDNALALLNQSEPEQTNLNTQTGRHLLLHSYQGRQQQQQRQQRSRSQDGPRLSLIDDDGNETELEHNEHDDERIHIAEWSYTRSNNNQQQQQQPEEDPNAIEIVGAPTNWTIYDLIRHKFDQQQTFQHRYQNALGGVPLANPPDLPNARRRGRGGRGRPGAGGGGQGFEVDNNGPRIQHALMSHAWKLEACHRRLKHYTDIVDDLIVVFDAAQLEIFKLMERDSFARFVKTSEFQHFVATRNSNAPKSE